MRRSHIAAILFLGIFLNNQTAYSQTSTNSMGLLSAPNNPPVGIGTVGVGVPQNALQIHHDPSNLFTLPAMMRLSDGANDSINEFGLLGLMPNQLATDTPFSSLSRGYDLILHEHQNGDIIITNFSHRTLADSLGGAIRFATKGDTTLLPIPSPGHADLERMTIKNNGNIGIDLPPDNTSGLGNPMEQVQIGGGVMPPPGYTSAVPGLTIYGGNRFEGMLKSGIGAGFFPYDWRYIAFNQYTNHSDTSATRSKRIAPMSSSVIAFAANDITNDGGMIDLHCAPYDSLSGLNVDTAHGLNLHLMGSKGLELWCDMSQADPYHHLFDCYRPGYLPYGITRNTNGLFFHHTPVYIGSDAGGSSFVNFQNLSVPPRLGDGMTWMLAVNGSALAKEFYVSLDWPDFVFLPSYHLTPLDEVEKYIEGNHHLPGIPSAKEMDTTGVPLGKTEAALTQKVEELTLYVIDQNKKIEQLEADIQELKNDKTK